MTAASLAWPSEPPHGISAPPNHAQAATEPASPICAGGGQWGIIYNPMSFSTTPIPGSGRRPFMGLKRLPDYIFRNGDEHGRKLTYWHPDGYYVRPDNRFLTDFNTYPGPVMLFMPRDRYAIASLLHDSACIHHGRWLAQYAEGPYAFEHCTSRDAARDFGLVMRCCGAWPVTAESFSRAVRRFGPQW